MAKFCGVVGFVESIEESPGIWKEQSTERTYSGDVFKNTRNLQTSNEVNDNITVSNEISILADEFAIKNFYNIRYVVFMGIRWKASVANIQIPRIILTLGGVYNGEQA